MSMMMEELVDVQAFDEVLLEHQPMDPPAA
jgi:hypothetical protein